MSDEHFLSRKKQNNNRVSRMTVTSSNGCREAAKVARHREEYEVTSTQYLAEKTI